MSFEIHNPIALVLLVFVPVVVLIGRRSLAGLSAGRAVVSTVIRCLILLATILALADLHITREGDLLTVVFAVDQSKSIPAAWRRREAFRQINNVVRGAREHHRVGLVLFGGDASIEKVPQPLGGAAARRWISGISSSVSEDHTDLAGAIRLAAAVFPSNSRKRIVLFSDGNETQGVAAEEAERARAAGVTVDVVPMDYSHDEEVLVEKVLLPSRLKINEPFMLRVIVWALQDCPAKLSLSQDGAPLGPPDPVMLAKGKNVIPYDFKEGLPEGGPYSFEARIESDHDRITENNVGVGYTFVEAGEPKVLVLENDPEHAQFLEAALREDKMSVTVAGVGAIPPNHKLAGYDCIVLSNVSAGDVTPAQMQTIASCVSDLGVGLVWVGGENSFGAGGWRNTPVERVSPVDCDIKQRRVLPKGALVLIMDAAEVPEGNRWSIEIACQAVEVLSAHDEVGLVVNSQWLVPLGEIGDKGGLLRTIETMRVGDVSNFNGMIKLAAEGLAKSNAATKHIVLMSDAGPCPWKPNELLIRQLNNKKITLTTVVFKDHAPQVAAIMERLALACRGHFYWPQAAADLPRIFMKEAALVTRSLIHEEPFSPGKAAGSDDRSPMVRGFDAVPRLGGYVVTTPKPDAEVPLIREFLDTTTQRTVRDPILAHRQEGLGKAVAFTSDAKNRWAADWVGWGGYKRFWAQTVRWALRAAAEGSVHTPTTIEISDGKAHVVLEALDEQNRPVNRLAFNAQVVRPDIEDPASRVVPMRLRQTGVGRYEGWFNADEAGSYFVHVHYEGRDNEGRLASGDPVSGAVVAYSPEHRELETNRSLMESIARITNGRVLGPQDDVFDENLPMPRHSSAPAWDLLMLCAILAFPVDVFVRKVVIDREQVRTAVSWAASKLPFVGARFERRLPAVDPAIARLLAKNGQVRERLDQQEVERPAPTMAQALRAARERGQQPTMADEELERGTAAVEPIETKRPRPAPARPALQADQAPTTPYTQRLLQAKKRALKKQKDARPDDGEGS